MLSINQNKGFSLTFKNGITISVQFGTINYCERQDLMAPWKSDMGNVKTTSQDAEIAIWDNVGNNYSFSEYAYDTAKGWVSSDDVAKWISAVQKATNIQTIKAPRTF